MVRKEGMNGTLMAAELEGACSGSLVEVGLGTAGCSAAETESCTDLCWGACTGQNWERVA